MKNKLPKLLAVLSLLSLLILYHLSFITHASAQEYLRTITIVPPTVEVSLNPGGYTQGILKVINDSPNPLTFNVSIQDFIVDNTGGAPDLIPPNSLSKKYSGAAWVGISPTYFTIQPHQKQILNYYIQVPSNGSPGGHYAAIVYQPTTYLGVKSTGTGVNTYIGSLFSIGVNGPIHEQAQVSQFSTDPFREFGPITIVTQIKNLGDLHIKPKGTITVYNMFGAQVANLPLPDHNVFPGAARDFSNTFGSTWMIGRYKAMLAARYGKQNNLPLVATVYFIVFPWKLAIIIILLLIAGVLFYLVKRKNKSQLHQDLTGKDTQPEAKKPTIPQEVAKTTQDMKE